jgi:hypothetical protein
MNDIEDEVRRLLDTRAERVHSNLTGPAIRARAEHRSVARRYGPLVSAVAVLAVAVISVLVLGHGAFSPTPSQPAQPVGITSVHSPVSTVTKPPTRQTPAKPARATTIVPIGPPNTQATVRTLPPTAVSPPTAVLSR